MGTLEHEYLTTKNSFNRALDRWEMKKLEASMFLHTDEYLTRLNKDIKQFEAIASLLFRATWIRKQRYLSNL